MMMVYSLINVPYASLLGVMSANPQVRTEFSSYRMTFAFGGSILVLFLIEPLVDIFSKMKITENIPAVSYTHLDVYKRQEIDRESFAAKLSPMEVKGIQMTETGNIPLVRDTPANIFLDGTWQLAEGGTEKERLHTIWTCLLYTSISYIISM